MMIIGLPNTGKSTLINRLSKRNATRTANKPGYTQSQQWIKIDSQTELLDTPGIMPPKIHSMEDGLKLCAIFAIPSKIVPDESTAIFLIKFLTEHYPNSIEKRYEFSPIDKDFKECLDQIGIKRNCLIKKAEVDYEKVYKLILTDFRDGKLGAISFEKPKSLS
jgi:ribosome biogenesis GTPase A